MWHPNRQIFSTLFAAVIALFTLSACDSTERAADTARAAIATYKANPTAENETAAQTALEKLNARINQLGADGKSAEAASQRSVYENLNSDFRAARLANAIENTRSAIQDLGESVKDTGQSIGEAFRDTFSATPTPPARESTGD